MRPRCDIREASGHRSRDWVAGGLSFALAWGLPGLTLAGSLLAESPARTWIGVPSLLWMGTACTANARHCGRTHCYFTAPLFFVMAGVALLDGLGLLVLGPWAWTWLGLGLVIGTAGLWWGTERLWGRFLRFDFQGQESKGSLDITAPTTLGTIAAALSMRSQGAECPERGLKATLKKPTPKLYGRDYEHLYVSHHRHDLRSLRAYGRRRLERLAGCVGRGVIRRRDCSGERRLRRSASSASSRASSRKASRRGVAHETAGPQANEEPSDMNVQTLRITGMTCDHCAKSIEEALAGMAGVVEAQVSYDEGTAHIKTEAGVDSTKLIDAVQGKGFGAEVLDRKGSTVTKGISDRRAHLGHRHTHASRQTATEIARRPTRRGHRQRRGGVCRSYSRRRGGCHRHPDREGNARRDLCERRLRALQDHDPGRTSRASAIRSSVRRYQKTSRRHRPPALLAQQQGRVDELRYAKYESILESNARITLLHGSAHFTKARTLMVREPGGNEKRLHADRILIATGASPSIPETPGLKDTPYWTLYRPVR